MGACEIAPRHALTRRCTTAGQSSEITHDTRDGGTGWGAPGVVRVKLPSCGGTTCEGPTALVGS
jgi:hypothetical protein